jgi:16S rRNA (guanine527-N7)-methyltransferase
MAATLAPEAFAAQLDVSRETLDRLKTYLALLERWNRAINLVGRDSLGDPWRRHFLDSAQLLPLMPALPEGRARRLLDLGSGAGFPGMVLAILGAGEAHLVEADQKKAAFLRNVARETETSVTLHACRIEDLPALSADVVTARALAPLPKLLGYAAPFLADEGVCLFLKGREAERELTAAAAEWKMKVRRHPSRSSEQGTILQIEELCRAQ